MEQLKKAKAYIDALTVDSPVNIPEKIVPDPDGFFTWDNEKRSKNNGQPYLYQWSYYNGVVFEGLKYVWEATGEKRYWDYGNAYMQALTKGGAPVETAGYVPYHGLDCYKTAALLLSFSDSEQSDCYLTAKKLYDDLTRVNACYTEPGIGGNYWHSWVKGKAPKYKVWLDGLYMGQPFLAEFAARIGDQEQLDKIAARFAWVRAHLRCPQNGIFYHAGDDQGVCTFFWTRAIGWYAMAQVNVMDYMKGAHLEDMKAGLKDFVDCMLAYQDQSGLWANLLDQPVTPTNRLETSGTSMMVYSTLKAIEKGWLDDTDGHYRAACRKAFAGVVDQKLIDGRLIDTYFKASANGQNNYEVPADYLTDEGKGVGPFIMAYAQMLKTKW